MEHAMEKLSDADVKSRLGTLPEWSEVGGSIQRTYQFHDFLAAMRFVDAVAGHAERVQHHPDMLIRWNKVTLTLSTHDAGGITEKDFQSAAAYDTMAAG
jgi:4a-hydroxytetrahydrobiopterin dehydratase